jgi:hypothetical protein
MITEREAKAILKNSRFFGAGEWWGARRNGVNDF